MTAAADGLQWYRSSACSDAACVEVARDAEYVYLRDGKVPDGAVLRFTYAEWRDFRLGMRQGDFDVV